MWFEEKRKRSFRGRLIVRRECDISNQVVKLKSTMVGQFTLKSRWAGECTELRVFWGVAGHYPYFMPSIFSRPIQVAIYSPGFTQNWPSWMYIGQSGPSTTIKATIPWWKRYQSFGEEWIQNSWQYVLGGREGGFVNRLIGAIFASLVCHSTFTRCVTESRFPDIGSPEGPWSN